MPTGEKYFNATLKRVVSLEDMRDNVIDYLQTSDHESLKSLVSGNLVVGSAKTGLSSDGNDKLKLDSATKAIDGLGNILDTTDIHSAYFEGVSFKNGTDVFYNVGLTYAKVPSGVQINQRTGLPEYDTWEDFIGVSGEPSLVTDNTTTITFDLDNVITEAYSHAGRKVRVWKVSPASGAISEAIAIEELTVTWSGTKNQVTTTGLLGQTTVDTTEANYVVCLLGPYVDTDVKANSVVLGTFDGNGPGAAPSGFDISTQRLLDYPIEAVADVIRLEATSGLYKVSVDATAADEATNQIEVNSKTAAEVFGVDGSGNVAIAGDLDCTKLTSTEAVAAYAIQGNCSTAAGKAIEGLATGTGTSYGVFGSTSVNATTGVGVYGEALATGAVVTYGMYGKALGQSSRGVYGLSSGSDGAGVRGDATHATGDNFGVHGRSESTSGVGVYGHANAETGSAYGVHGETDSSTGRGVYGEANDTGAVTTYGVYGKTSGDTGYGVYGEAATSASGENYGVYGTTSSSAGVGVGGAASALDAAAVKGVNTVGTAIKGEGFTTGILGESTSTAKSYGVKGKSDGQNTASAGLYGEAASTTGTVYGVHGYATASANGIGVYGEGGDRGIKGTTSTVSGVGVQGVTPAASTTGKGVLGSCEATTGINYGVFGSVVSADGYALYGNGNSMTTGSFTVGDTSSGSEQFCSIYMETAYADTSEETLVIGNTTYGEENGIAFFGRDEAVSDYAWNTEIKHRVVTSSGGTEKLNAFATAAGRFEITAKDATGHRTAWCSFAASSGGAVQIMGQSGSSTWSFVANDGSPATNEIDLRIFNDSGDYYVLVDNGTGTNKDLMFTINYVTL